MTTTNKPPRTCANCARARVVDETTLYYECRVTDKPVDPSGTCECWKKRCP